MIWGSAAAGAKVQIAWAGRRHAAQADAAGRWEAVLDPLPAGGPYQMKVMSGRESITVSDILAGDVYLAGGQSNMEWPLKHSAVGRLAVENADFPQIRFFNVLKILFTGELEETPEKFPLPSAWRPATRAHAGDFSAVAFYFACELHERLGVPIGIVECNLGGSSASAWVSRPVLESDSDLRSYLDEYDEVLQQLDLDAYVENNRRARKLAVRILPIIQRVIPEEEQPGIDPARLPPRIRGAVDAIIQPGPRCLFGRPCGLYENMLLTVVPYTLRGVIYYQGEADDFKARLYGRLLRGLIDEWRRLFRDPDLPFLFVQLAAFGYQGNPDGELFALIREQQALVACTTPHAHLAVAMDVGSAIDIHPRRKQPVGHRLALIARARVYGEDIEDSGPVFRSMEISGERIILRFDHAASGLVCSEGELKGFRICAANRKYYPAEARIVGPRIELFHGEILRPAAASYGWGNFMEVNFYNGAGLPAVPFRTDRYL
jgi:sialate O-acetylesterase